VPGKKSKNKILVQGLSEISLYQFLMRVAIFGFPWVSPPPASEARLVAGGGGGHGKKDFSDASDT